MFLKCSLRLQLINGTTAFLLISISNRVSTRGLLWSEAHTKTLTHARCLAWSTWGGTAAINTSLCFKATHIWSYEPPGCPAHLVAWLSAGETWQTHTAALCLSRWVWFPRPGGRHGALLVYWGIKVRLVGSVTHDSCYIMGCWILTVNFQLVSSV